MTEEQKATALKALNLLKELTQGDLSRSVGADHPIEGIRELTTKLKEIDEVIIAVEGLANDKLIANAPELLELCKQMSLHISNNSDCEPGSSTYRIECEIQNSAKILINRVDA